MSMCGVFTMLCASSRQFPSRCDREDQFIYAWFVFVASSSSWTRSSSLQDLRQDDRYPGSHYYHCYASCFVLSLCCATYRLLFKPPKLTCQPLTFSPFLANHCLAMLPLCSAPLIALLVAGEVEDCFMVDRIMLGYHNISYLINALGKGWKARPYAWCFVPLLPPQFPSYRCYVPGFLRS